MAPFGPSVVGVPELIVSLRDENALKRPEVLRL